MNDSTSRVLSAAIHRAKQLEALAMTANCEGDPGDLAVVRELAALQARPTIVFQGWCGLSQAARVIGLKPEEIWGDVPDVHSQCYGDCVAWLGFERMANCYSRAMHNFTSHWSGLLPILWAAARTPDNKPESADNSILAIGVECYKVTGGIWSPAQLADSTNFEGLDPQGKAHYMFSMRQLD